MVEPLYDDIEDGRAAVRRIEGSAAGQADGHTKGEVNEREWLELSSVFDAGDVE
jgi:hypothetical protein